MSNDIAFRRIRGRIVPIRLNKQKRETIKGGAIAGAGAAIAVGGGSLYKRSVQASAKFAMKAFDNLTPPPGQFTGMKRKFKSTAQMSFDDIIGKTQSANSQKVFNAANRLAKFSGAVRRISPILGGALFAYGATKIAAANKKDKINPEVAALLGAGAGSSLPFALKKGQQLFEFGLNNRQVKMNFVKEAAKTAAKKFASKAFGAAF